ncbi:MAG: hypothetical protein IJ224_09075 [Lachnospiraceae bacterium]|nr:hypothetical protein [Lachnospiraceae bacterium]
MAKDIREENVEYLSRLSKKKLSRVIAWICLIIIAALIVATFITGIMGSKLFMPFLALTITIPLLMYVALWIGKVLSSAGKDDESE